MGDNRNYLGSLEESVLLAVVFLAPSAYGVELHDTLREAGRGVSIGSLYVTLSRLEEKGYVSSKNGEPTRERGGKAKRYFSITGLGQQALDEAAESRARLTQKKLASDGGLSWNL